MMVLILREGPSCRKFSIIELLTGKHLLKLTFFIFPFLKKYQNIAQGKRLTLLSNYFTYFTVLLFIISVFVGEHRSVVERNLKIASTVIPTHIASNFRHFLSLS